MYLTINLNAAQSFACVISHLLLSFEVYILNDWHHIITDAMNQVERCQESNLTFIFSSSYWSFAEASFNSVISKRMNDVYKNLGF